MEDKLQPSLQIALLIYSLIYLFIYFVLFFTARGTTYLFSKNHGSHGAPGDHPRTGGESFLSSLSYNCTLYSIYWTSLRRPAALSLYVSTPPFLYPVLLYCILFPIRRPFISSPVYRPSINKEPFFFNKRPVSLFFFYIFLLSYSTLATWYMALDSTLHSFSSVQASGVQILVDMEGQGEAEAFRLRCNCRLSGLFWTRPLKRSCDQLPFWTRAAANIVQRSNRNVKNLKGTPWRQIRAQLSPNVFEGHTTNMAVRRT